MPYKALVLYPIPDDPQGFRDHYENTHLPLIAKLPGLRSLSYSFDLKALQGESPYLVALELEWDDAEGMGASLGSPEGDAMMADMAPYMTKDTVVLHYSLQDFLSR
jgi:uncharacterized protein (TIGR02118 family)